MRTVLGGIAGLVLCTAAAQAAPINTFQNGSFENGVAPDGSIGFTELYAPDTSSITGWSVDSGSVDYIGRYWQPQQGSRSIDLSGNGPGTLSQTFSTTAGQSYSVGFWIAGNPDGGPQEKSVQVDVSGSLISDLRASARVAPNVYTFDVTGHTRLDMGWEFHSFTFTGSGTDTLTFAELGGTAYGTALDNVSVSAVPLPASAPMFGAALLALAAAGYGLKRKKVAAAAA